MTSTATLGAAVDGAARALAAAGVPSPRLEARLILAHVLGTGTETITGHPERGISGSESRALGDLVGRRADREPLAFVLGHREFWSLPIRVGRETLVPRPDSETVIETALRRIVYRRARLRILDLGTGSGCLLAALLSELPNATGLGVDRSLGALRVARENARTLGYSARARFVCGSWFDGLGGSFDLIVANPPYVPAGDIAGLEPEVARHEPRLALDGGIDGLDSFRVVAPEMPRFLATGGTAVVEVGVGQAEDVAALLRTAGLQGLEINDDLAGRPRCVSGTRV